MRKDWLRKVASFCLITSMALLPTTQAIAEEETTETVAEALTEATVNENTEEINSSEEISSEEITEITETESIEAAQDSQSEETETIMESESQMLETEEAETDEIETVESVEMETQNESVNGEDATYECDGYAYKLVNGQAVITGYTGTEKEIRIPTQLNGVPVTKIQTIRNTQLEKVTVTASVTKYEAYAFNGCSSLKTVKLESSADIEQGMFMDCKNLENVEITGQPKKIGFSAFSLTGIKKIDIPSSVTT